MQEAALGELGAAAATEPHPDATYTVLLPGPCLGHLEEESPRVWGWDRESRVKWLQSSKSEQQLDSGCQLEQRTPL